jgi:hypothetical protein
MIVGAAHVRERVIVPYSDDRLGTARCPEVELGVELIISFGRRDRGA